MQRLAAAALLLLLLFSGVEADRFIELPTSIPCYTGVCRYFESNVVAPAAAWHRGGRQAPARCLHTALCANAACLSACQPEATPCSQPCHTLCESSQQGLITYTLAKPPSPADTHLARLNCLHRRCRAGACGQRLPRTAAAADQPQHAL